MKIMITGGHLAPALACIDELLTKKDIELVFVGKKYNNDREKTLSLEYQEVVSRRVPFINLKTGRLTRTVSLSSLLNLLTIPVGLWNSYFILLKEKPDVILTFGGYLAFPIGLMTLIWGMPIYVHEQTIHPGITNRILGLIAKKVFVSFNESKKFFSKKKIVVSGNPVRKQIFVNQKKAFDINEKLPVIYVTGGSLGSHSINVHLANILPHLLENYIIVHQTGNVAEFKDYEKLEDYKKQLPSKLQKRYFLKEHINGEEIGNIFKTADLVVCRSGANTFFELVVLKKPALMIPLPWSAHGEQKKQAELLKKYGVAEVFDQSGESLKLLELIEKMMNNIKHYQTNFNNLKTTYSQNAAEIITDSVIQDQQVSFI